MKKKKNGLNLAEKIVVYVLLTLVGAIMLLPLYWSLISSIRPDIESISGLNLWPKTIIWDNYINLFRDIPMGRYIFNTLFVTLLGCATNLLFCSLCAYALAKFRFPGRRVLQTAFLISMMIPGVVLIVPQFMVTLKLGLTDSLFGVVLPGAVGVWGILFMKQFFLAAPGDMAEAARIDGSGELRIFLQLYLPAASAGLITLGIFTFNSYWNSFMWPNIILTEPDLYLLTMALKNYQIYYSENMGPLMAGSIISVLPVFIIYVFGQKYFVNNMSFSGMKG